MKPWPPSSSRPGNHASSAATAKALSIWIERTGKRWYVRTPKGSDIAIEGGEFPGMPVKTARRERDVLLAMIERGVDSVALRRQKTKPASAAPAGRGKSGPTFLELARDFVAFKTAEGARPATIEKYEFALRKLKLLHNRPAGELTVKVLADVFWRIAARGNRRESAERAAILCSQILGRAAATTDAGEAPAIAARLARKSQPRVAATNHAAIVEPQRFGQLLRAIDGYTRKSDYVKIALQLLAHLFPRPGELRRMRWRDLDLAKRVWLIPAEHAKSKRVRRVPLSRQAVRILKEQHGLRYLGDADVYAWPGPRADRPMWENTLGAALNTLGFKDEHRARVPRDCQDAHAQGTKCAAGRGRTVPRSPAWRHDRTGVYA